MQSIKIYSTIKSARLDYVLQFVFTRVLNSSWCFVKNKTEADVVYGEVVDGKCSYASSSLISEKHYPEKVSFNNGVLLFNSENFFDPFSAIFYCLSRMEELGAVTDAHDRFSGNTSVFNGTWENPWVDVWIDDLKRELELTIIPPSNVLLTVDLDFGYRYLGKGLLRTAAALIRDVFSFRWKLVKLRLQAILKQKDPFDGMYDWLTKNFCASSLRFFALASPFGKYDKGLHPATTKWKRLKTQLNSFSVGLHPSYNHLEQKERLHSGIQILRSNGFDIDSNRFHFLRFKVSKDYKRLLGLGVCNDYSMGFADKLGFRAQTAHSFPYFDLNKEESTNLTIHPFMCMDAVYCNYQALSKLEMKEKVVEMANRVFQLGGTFCLLWHDHTLIEGTETRVLLEEILQEIKP
jgi:hypothetical protein